MDIVKIDDATIQVTTQAPVPEPVVQTYDYNKLVSDRDILVAELSAITSDKQKKIDELNALIAGAESVGITVKPTGVADEIVP